MFSDMTGILVIASALHCGKYLYLPERVTVEFLAGYSPRETTNWDRAPSFWWFISFHGGLCEIKYFQFELEYNIPYTTAGHRPLHSHATSLSPRLLSYSCCQPPCLYRHLAWERSTLRLPIPGSSGEHVYLVDADGHRSVAPSPCFARFYDLTEHRTLLIISNFLYLIHYLHINCVFLNK